MKLFSETQILDENFRALCIREIQSNTNKRRKREAMKRYEILKDNTVKYVVEKLQNEGLLPETVRLMENRAANISICRKVIEKLARCYSGGVIRDGGGDLQNVQIADMSGLLDIDGKMKKSDKYRKLFRNCFVQVVPEKVEIDKEGKEKYRLKMKVYGPWQYDVIESSQDPECAGVVILSDFHDRSQMHLPLGNTPGVSSLEINQGATTFENRDVATTPSAVPPQVSPQTYIWWSDNYHFTTDQNGKIITSVSPEDLLNPIRKIPGASICEDQDGHYWSEGGQDLTDGSILVNTLVTDMNAIAYMQGWGQMVITGKHVPEQLKMGPHNALILRYDQAKDEPEPKVTVVNANPPLADWMKSIEQYVALLLSTNNLSPSNVAVKLDPSDFPSGIAMLIEKSEATDNIESAQKHFYHAEQCIWEVVKRWQNIYAATNSLSDEFASVGAMPEDLKVSIKFNDTKEVVTEKERLENIKLRKELGLNTEEELLMMDNPGMTQEQAAEKLKKIKEQKLVELDAKIKEYLQTQKDKQLTTLDQNIQSNDQNKYGG